MAKVMARENEPLERMIRRFKKKVDDEGIIKEFRDRQYFKKPSTIKREKKKDAIRKAFVKMKQDERRDNKNQR